MSAETLDQVVQHLLDNGIEAKKQIAIIGQATTPEQKIVTSRLEDYHKKFANVKHVSPTIVIIGDVVQLHERFAWLTNDKEQTEYFRHQHQKSKQTHNA
jgi:siroheme synthase